jgi:hypothetical protein
LQGKRYDLDKALDDLSKIIPFIKGYTKKSQNLDLQDFFLKLGIEAGTYCALGIKRATSEILQGLLQTDSEQTEKSAHYVITLKARLQQLRQNISDTMTQKFIGSHRILEDIHLQKNLKLYFRGFLPLSLPAAKSVNIIEALTTNFHLYQNLRKECMIEYKSRLLAEVKDFGMQNATSYIYSLIQSNPQLSDEEKEDILDYFTTQPKDMNPIEDRFLYLMLYQIGILNLTEE